MEVIGDLEESYFRTQRWDKSTVGVVEKGTEFEEKESVGIYNSFEVFCYEEEQKNEMKAAGEVRVKESLFFFPQIGDIKP